MKKEKEKKKETERKQTELLGNLNFQSSGSYEDLLQQIHSIEKLARSEHIQRQAFILGSFVD